MNWHSKGAAMNTMASQVRCQYPQYQPRQQAFSPDYQQTVNNHRLPGKLIDYDCFQRNRQTFPNGGSNVQVVFLGAVSGKEAGTGVFLPRTFASAPEHKKKTGKCCFLVQLDNTMDQVLNLGTYLAREILVLVKMNSQYSKKCL